VSDSAIAVARRRACRRVVFAPGHLGELTWIVPFDVVDKVLVACGGMQQRVRGLPSRVVVYLLFAGAFFESMGWSQVWARLTASGPCRLAPARSSITEAMRRVGTAPLRGLFDLLKGPAATTARQAARFAGRLVVAIDGTTIAVRDTEANLAVYPKRKGGPNGPPGYPLIRLVAVVACGTRSIIDAMFGRESDGEQVYAEMVAAMVGPGMLLLADRNFPSIKFVAQLAARGADFLMRAKMGRNALRLPIMRRLGDGSYLSRVGNVPVRVIEAHIVATALDGTTTGGTYRLITSLLDPTEAPALTLARLYHQRWEIETAYLELKSTILGGRVLRAGHPDGVVQETWALLGAYQVLRTAMADAVLAQPDVDPDRASFTIALNTARDQIIRAQGIIAGTRIDLLGRIGTAVLADLLPDRRPRIRARIRKRPLSPYSPKKKDQDRHTRPAVITTIILTKPPEP
jgi:hypothetical protein